MTTETATGYRTMINFGTFPGAEAGMTIATQITALNVCAVFTLLFGFISSQASMASNTICRD